MLTETVLVVLLHLLQLVHGHLQNLLCLVPPSNRHKANPRLDYLHSRHVDCSRRCRLLLRYSSAVPAHLTLLEQVGGRTLHQHGHHCRPRLPVQRV